MRTRSVLIDTPNGKIYANTAATSSANSLNVIGGSTPKINGFISSSTTLARPATNLGLSEFGLEFPLESIITKVSLKASTSSVGTDIIVNVKKGSTYSSATSVGTYTLTAGSTSVDTAANISITAGQRVFADITQVGSVRAGAGLCVFFTYYSG